jgi:hypothetical protein
MRLLGTVIFVITALWTVWGWLNGAYLLPIVPYRPQVIDRFGFPVADL